MSLGTSHTIWFFEPGDMVGDLRELSAHGRYLIDLPCTKTRGGSSQSSKISIQPRLPKIMEAERGPSARGPIGCRSPRKRRSLFHAGNTLDIRARLRGSPTMSPGSKNQLCGSSQVTSSRSLQDAWPQAMRGRVHGLRVIVERQVVANAAHHLFEFRAGDKAISAAKPFLVKGSLLIHRFHQLGNPGFL